MKIFYEIRKSLGLSREQLSQKLSVSLQTIAAYESGRIFPSFKVLVKTKDIFQFSLDYIMTGKECCYPRNLRFLRLVKNLDELSLLESKKNIKNTTISLLGKDYLSKFSIKQDQINIELSKNFHSNLKNMRNLRKITQSSLANSLGITRTLLSQYELRIFPAVDKLMEFSKILNISIHALATGEKLCFEFKDKKFGRVMLLADHFLSLEDHKFLIRLMESALKK